MRLRFTLAGILVVGFAMSQAQAQTAEAPKPPAQERINPENPKPESPKPGAEIPPTAAPDPATSAPVPPVTAPSPKDSAAERPTPATQAPATSLSQPASQQPSANAPAQSAPGAPQTEAPAEPAPSAVPPLLPQPIPLPDSSTTAKKGDRPIANPLPQPATTTEPATKIDPARFGGKAPDAAYGAYQRGLYKTAYNLALERAKQGDAPAQTLVAEILARGLGMPANAAEAAKWYQRAAEQGVPEAQFQYALILIDGRQVKKDEKKAQVLLQAAAEAGNPLAQFNLAQLLLEQDPGDAGLTRAVAYYQKAAETGLADAQYAMAQIYANGAGGKTKDDTEARKLLVLAAQQNYDTAQLDLGQWLIDGRGGKRDLKSGFNWTKRAAEGGNVAAQNRLAKLYEGGIGVDGDLVTAAAWFIVARRAGLADPQMDDFMQGLDEEQTKQALQKANRLP